MMQFPIASSQRTEGIRHQEGIESDERNATAPVMNFAPITNASIYSVRSRRGPSQRLGRNGRLKPSMEKNCMRQGQDVGVCENMTTDPSVASFILRLQVPSGSGHAPFPYEGSACSLLASFPPQGWWQCQMDCV